MGRYLAGLAAAGAIAAAQALAAPTQDMVTPMGENAGMMSVPMERNRDGVEVDDTLIFEPIQLFAEMFQRDDVVFLMRHGPTDWSKLDVKDVAPTDCENQRVLSEEGREDMRAFGQLLAFNEIRPSKVIVSEWCRNQQTLDAIRAGYEIAEPGGFAPVEIVTEPELNLLFSLQGAPDVSELRRIVSEWDGPQTGTGPLLVISHFTNIQELTDFNVYEGEVLVLDPKRENRVLGYFRLSSAEPDVGHFGVE